MTELEGFTCHVCGKWHDGLPLDYGYDAPQYWSEKFKTSPNSFLNSDYCTIEQKDYFVRGIMEIPIIGRQEGFRWGVWTTLSKTNFDRMIELSDSPKLLEEPPYFGWLSSSIDLYPETLNLKTNLRVRRLDWRPFVELEPTNHPLALEQRHGITVQRVREIAEHILHNS
jgi:hypothetical protein